MKTAKAVKGKAKWTYETERTDYEVLLYYEAQPCVPWSWTEPEEPATCEIYEVEVLRVSEFDLEASTIARRPPTEEEMTRIAAEILDQCERSKAKRDELWAVCFEDADQQGRNER